MSSKLHRIEKYITNSGIYQPVQRNETLTSCGLASGSSFELLAHRHMSILVHIASISKGTLCLELLAHRHMSILVDIASISIGTLCLELLAHRHMSILVNIASISKGTL
jgi:hypothetical protein